MASTSTTTSNLELSTVSSSSSSSQPSTWDVFLSFYGKDTRGNFILHLYTALDQAGFITFRDDPALKKGEEISSGLLNAIKNSKMFVVVISENYARSRWCLDELAEILSGCEKKENRVVPVFYYVDPTNVRYQKGSFGEALEAHKKFYSDDMIHKWKSALAQIADLSGHHLRKDAKEDEAQIIQEIIVKVAQASTKVLYLDEHLYGIDSAVEEICWKLRMELDDVRAIGICGMGGIGKTTTAKAFYNKYSNLFDVSCFIENVRQYSHGGSPLLPLLERLVTELLRKKDCKVTDVASGIRQLTQILRSKKALIVLDDLDQTSYSQFLVKVCKLFSARSRIILTTRDVNLIYQLKIDMSGVDVYMVKKLEHNDSLELFSYHAFGKPKPTASLRNLSLSFVSHAGGIPLATKVLGSILRGRTQVSFWIGKLEEVRRLPVNDIHGILQVSYDDLSEMEKEIFLDIAFFFVGKYHVDADEIIESCGFCPKVGIPILVERCLLQIDENYELHMHNLIQDMGRDLGKSTRLCWQGTAWNDLQNQEGLDKIEGLIIDLTRSTEKQINSRIFEKLPKLRLLEIINAHGTKEHFKSPFHELRCIYWSHCTWTQLPSSFQAQKLVSLYMAYSNLKMLWNGAMPFKSLKMINLGYSMNLTRTPDFGNSKLIKRIFFEGCESLLNLHPSIRELTGLYILNLNECTRLKELGEPILKRKRSLQPMTQWASMWYLYLGHLSNLRRLPEQLGDMKGLKLLDANHTAIEELPDSITQLEGLYELELSNCKKLRKLPEEFRNMKGLSIFKACNTAISKLPDSFAGLINLVKLDLSCCKSLRSLPNDMWKLTLLEVLNLGQCSKLDRLPEQLGKMQCLEHLYASQTAIEEVSDSIELLSKLQVLNLGYCKKLKYVPNSVWKLPSLEQLYLLRTGMDDIGGIKIPGAAKDIKLVALGLSCNIRLWLPLIQSFSSLKRLVLSDMGESLSSTKPFSLSKLVNLKFLELNANTSVGPSFPELPPSLTKLTLCSHATLVRLPDLSSLKQLKMLDIVGCCSLESLPPLPPHLQSLTVYDCTSLQDLPDMSVLKGLLYLYFGRCGNSKSVGLRSSYVFTRVSKQFSYRSIGSKLRFNIPPLLEDNFLCLALWVLFTSKNDYRYSISAAVTNQTNGFSMGYLIPVYSNGTGVQEYSLSRCIHRDEIPLTTGDRIEISFQRQLYDSNGEEAPLKEVKVEACAAHVIQKTHSTPDFPSVLNFFLNRDESNTVREIVENVGLQVSTRVSDLDQ